jgi:hypothetical protein
LGHSGLFGVIPDRRGQSFGQSEIVSLSYILLGLAVPYYINVSI